MRAEIPDGANLMSGEYARWIAPIGTSPRRVAKHWSCGGVDFEPEDRVFFMFGSANCDEACFGI